METIIFADAVALVITYLNDRHPSHDIAHRKIPAERPAEFVTVQRTGGVPATIVSDEPQITVDCWGETSEGAHDLCQLVRAWLHALEGRVVDGIPFYRVVEFGGPNDVPDPASLQPRYRMTVSIHLRAAQILP